MFRNLFLLFLFSVNIVQAQKIEKYYDYKWQPVSEPSTARFYALIEKEDSVWSREDYYLREAKLQMKGFYKDADCKIEHGPFLYFHRNGRLETRGQYVNGKKFGTWVGFHENGMISDSMNYNENGWVMGMRLAWHDDGMMADSTFIQPDGSAVSIRWWQSGFPSEAGYYSKGFLQHGKWQYWHSNGQLASLEIFDHGKLVNKEYFDENGVKQSDTTNRDRIAGFPGGLKAWQKYLYKNLYFPEQYKITNADQAIVLVRFAVNENGSISDIVVTVPFHPDFDKIATDVISHSPKWTPAIRHNRKIKEYHTQPVTFMQK